MPASVARPPAVVMLNLFQHTGAVIRAMATLLERDNVRLNLAGIPKGGKV